MKVAVVQLCSKLDPAHNLKTLGKYLAEIQAAGTRYVFLPECFYSLSNGQEATPYPVSKDNQHFKEIVSLAQRYSVYLLGGSVAYQSPHFKKLLNRSFQISPEGAVLGVYDKRNLFSVDLSRHSSKKQIDEGTLYERGQDLCLLELDEMKLGVQICFDLRFPEIARLYSGLGANVLSYSSAFTVPTGRAHWHALLRARAIENQCFVVASAQWGQNNEIIETFGHSLVVDPWGEIIAELETGEGHFAVELDFERLQEVRSRLPVLLPQNFSREWEKFLKLKHQARDFD